MAEVFWTGQAEQDLLNLPGKAAAAVLEKIENVRRYPEMYARMEGPEWEGCRKIFVEPHWILVYKVPADGDAVVMYVRDARR